ncbi:dynein axonemal intermediate chain 3 [Pseudoliparis swirei]|uniref:dynein axonemal intermediate chain 3 n=1 Tax=Pseudoliparis swirei TaxID=2059687 RepID=UPI0024BDAC35|nr:dynein axonemal intermediate chain 3 [Pseudoliparis swirei]
MPPKKPKSAASRAGKKGKAKATPAPAEDPGHPDDIFPLVLTSATQELFGCRADDDVTEESPHKLLRKDDIVQDLKMRAAVSDFSPVKQIVLEYPDAELLLVFDRDFVYGQSFYLALTPEAKERILNSPEPETPEVFEDEVVKSPEPKPWISLGSEQEIVEEYVSEKRRYKILKVNRQFGLPINFSDRNAADAKDGNLGWAPYEDSRSSIRLTQRDCGTQAVSTLQSSSTQTRCNSTNAISTQCTPREFSCEEKESILQSESVKNMCISVMPIMLQALQQEEIMNVFLDDWTALGSAAEDWSGKVTEGLMLYQSFTDQNYSKDKKISSVHWHPNLYGVIAVALTEKKEERLNESATLVLKASLILFYNFSDPSNPQLLLESPADICAFEFCPSDPNIIVGGCTNGQVVLWDISAHVSHLQETQPGKTIPVVADPFELDDDKENQTPVVRFCAVSALESSHKAPITDVQWLPPTFEVTRTGVPVENKYNISTQIVTCSPDCAVMFWDVRASRVSQSASDRKQNVDQKAPYSVPDTFQHLDRTWKPLFKVSLPKIDLSGEYAPLKFSLEHYTCTANKAATGSDDSPEVIPDYSRLTVPSEETHSALEQVNTKLFIGTEVGEIIYTDWKLVKDDSERLHSAKPLHCFSIHHWQVNTVQRSPFFNDIILTIGSWNFAIWKEGVMDGPIILSPNSEQACTAGCWSPSRPAVVFIGKEDGSVDVWNLLEKNWEPAQVNAHVTNAKITAIGPWIASPKQHFLAVTDDLGILRVFEIPKLLYVPSKNEGSNLRKYFEGEEQRLKDLLRCEELWAKEKEEAEELSKRMKSVQPVKSPVEDEDEEEYKSYLVLEESILKGLGLWPKTRDA